MFGSWAQEELEDLFCAVVPCQKGSLMHYNYLARDYPDILHLEREHDSLTKLRIVVKPGYDIDNVLDFCRNLVLGLDYEVVVEDEYDLVK